MNDTALLLALANMSSGALLIIFSIPLLKGHVKMNRIYGVRFRKCFESEENWYRINRYSAKRVIIWSIPIILVGLITFFIDFKAAGDFRSTLILILACAPLIVLIPAIESYLYVRKL